jgi:FkbM family methyltransferase
MNFKKYINKIIINFGKTNLGLKFYNKILNLCFSSISVIEYHSILLKFSTPNILTKWRVDTFSSKEPETLNWIEKFNDKAIFWDIGANVGLYSIYSALKRNTKVYSFEPSVFNLELLSRNIFLNNLSDSITIIPLPLSNEIEENKLRLITTEWGGALSTFGKDFGWDGNKLNSLFEFKTISISMDEITTIFKIPFPDYIKMDVDGIEHFILKGGAEVLKKVKSVLIEINDDFEEQANLCHLYLKEAGLKLETKEHSEISGNSNSAFKNSYNQIWIR